VLIGSPSEKVAAIDCIGCGNELSRLTPSISRWFSDELASANPSCPIRRPVPTVSTVLYRNDATNSAEYFFETEQFAAALRRAPEVGRVLVEDEKSQGSLGGQCWMRDDESPPKKAHERRSLTARITSNQLVD